MKKLFLTTLVAMATAAAAQTGAPASTPASTPAPAASGSTPTQPAASAQPQQKTIKDPTEYNAYMAAIGQQEPAKKAAGLETFLSSFPNSVVREDALEALMVAYQQSGDVKTADAANRLLQANPGNVRALALLTYLKRASVDSAPAAQQTQILEEAAGYAQRGVQAVQSMTQPDGVSADDFKKLKDGTMGIFSGALGHAALAKQDFATAQKELSAAVEKNPNSVQDVYLLATAYLQPKPPDYVNGLWFMARAVNLLAPNPTFQATTNKNAIFYYKKYHGSEEGWQQLIAQTQNTAMPPAGFTIAPAPPPLTKKEFADTIMKKYNGDISQMAYEDWLFIMASGNQAAADQVWNYLKGKVLPLSKAKVVSATRSEVMLATTSDDQDKNKADVTVRFATPLLLKNVPTVGKIVNYSGTTSSYTPDPLMITLTEGKDMDTKAAPPAHKPPAKKPTHTARSSG